MCKEGYTDQQIADELQCNIKTVERNRKKLDIYKTGSGKLQDNLEDLSKEEKAQTLADKTFRQQKEYWHNVLVRSHKYDKLKSMYNKYDLKEFEDRWIDAHMSMDDLSPPEEDMIDLMIMYKMRLDDNQKSYTKAKSDLLAIEKEIAGRELDTENTRDLQLREMTIDLTGNIIQINKDTKDLTEKFEKIQRSLNQTREQREKSRNIGQDTFFKLVQGLQQKQQRIESGEYTERMREATAQSIKRFKQPHQFGDGSIEPIYLDGADFVKDQQE